MVEQTVKSARPRCLRASHVFVWLLTIVGFGVFASLLVATVWQIVNPPPAHRLVLVQDIPLPSALPTRFLPNVKVPPQKEDPLAPGVSVRFDHFDFQALDPTTHLLFLAHSEPAPDKFSLINHQFNPEKDSQIDGHVLVFDTQHNKIVGRVDVPQIAGIVAAPDLGRVYAADANDNLVYMIDEHTLHATPIPLGDNEGPDAIEYDQDDHKVFVSDVGVPSPNNINPNNQNIAVIDTTTNHVTKINLGHLPKLPSERVELTKFGYDVAHIRYDSVLHLLFLVIGQVTDQSAPSPSLPPPRTRLHRSDDAKSG